MLILNSVSKHSVNMDRGRKLNLAGFRSMAILHSPAPFPALVSFIVWLYGLVPFGLMFLF